jgi:hypothetical protein
MQNTTGATPKLNLLPTTTSNAFQLSLSLSHPPLDPIFDFAALPDALPPQLLERNDAKTYAHPIPNLGRHGEWSGCHYYG